MIIKKDYNNKPLIYSLCNVIVDTGTKYNDRIAAFPTLETAALVLRYMKGVNMSDGDTERAKTALIEAQGS